jgi:hypothetical protein
VFSICHWELVFDNFPFAQDPYVHEGCFGVDLKSVSPYAICAHWGIFGFQTMVYGSLG